MIIIAWKQQWSSTARAMDMWCFSNLWSGHPWAPWALPYPSSSELPGRPGRRWELCVETGRANWTLHHLAHGLSLIHSTLWAGAVLCMSPFVPQESESDSGTEYPLRQNWVSEWVRAHSVSVRFDHQALLKMLSDSQHREGKGQWGLPWSTILQPPASALRACTGPFLPVSLSTLSLLHSFRISMSLFILFLLSGRTPLHLAGWLCHQKSLTSFQFERFSHFLGSHFFLFEPVCVCVCVLVAQSCLTLCDPMDCSQIGSSVCVILRARILEWVAITFSNWTLTPVLFMSINLSVSLL